MRVPDFKRGDKATILYNNPAPEPAPASRLVWTGFPVVHHLNATNAAPGSASAQCVDMNFVKAFLGLGAQSQWSDRGHFEFTASEVAKGITDSSRFTISMVVKAANNPPAHGTRFATNKTAYNGPGFDVMYFDKEPITKKITVRGNNASKTAHFDPSGIDWTQPHHLAVVFDGDTCACYVDGTPLTTDGVATSAAIDPVSTHANTLKLGNGADKGNVLPGIYDEFRLRNGAATAADIACEYADLMNAGAGLYTLRADLGAPTILYIR